MKLKLKDFIFLGIMSVIGLVVYMISMALTTPFGAFGHTISPGFFGLLGGTLFVFLCYKLGKPGMMSIFVLVQLLFFTLMGAAYLPWFITSMASAIIGDIILAKIGFDKALPQLIAWPLINLGSAFGTFIPVWFFADKFKEDWVKRGQSVEAMDDSIKYATGMWGIISVVSVIALSVAGVLIGRLILKKYFKK